MRQLTQLIKKSLFILKSDGLRPLSQRVFTFFRAKTNATFSLWNFNKINSKKYWDFRLKHNWKAVGGASQTQFFCISAFANINFYNLHKINSILDYGCATGDASPVLRTFFPAAEIYISDCSNVGIQMALKKFSKLDIKEFSFDRKVDFVYCSNVIEHIENPREFVKSLIRLSQKYILIQCPWDERHHDGALITSLNPLSEHIWTVNKDFFNQFIESHDVNWSIKLGQAPFAWEGLQAYFLGELVQQPAP